MKVDKDAKYTPSLLRAILCIWYTIFYRRTTKLYMIVQYAGPVVLSAYLSDATNYNQAIMIKIHWMKHIYTLDCYFNIYGCTFMLAQYFHRCYHAGMKVRLV